MMEASERRYSTPSTKTIEKNVRNQRKCIKNVVSLYADFSTVLFHIHFLSNIYVFLFSSCSRRTVISAQRMAFKYS